MDIYQTEDCQSPASDHMRICLFLKYLRGTLMLSPQAFGAEKAKPSLALWLVRILETSETDVSSLLQQARRDMWRLYYACVHRIFHSAGLVPAELLTLGFLSKFFEVFYSSPTVKSLAALVWENGKQSLELSKSKTMIVTLLSEKILDLQSLTSHLRQITALLKVSDEYGQFVMTGSDFIDCLVAIWDRLEPEIAAQAKVVVYYSLLSLIRPHQEKALLLSDQIYALCSSRRNVTSSSLLDDIIIRTPFLKRLRRAIHRTGEGGSKNVATKLQNVYDTIARELKWPESSLHQPRSTSVYHDTAIKESGTTDTTPLHYIRDMFPLAEENHVSKLLREHENHIDTVIEILLKHQDSIQQSTKECSSSGTIDRRSVAETLPSQNWSPPVLPRRSMFNEDDLSTLSATSRRLYFAHHDTEKIPKSGSSANKSAILSALMTFDSDSDELDDTYEGKEADLGKNEAAIDLNDLQEERLFMVWRASPRTFFRDGATRQSIERALLRSETGMTDEQIEGWGLMLTNNKRRLRFLRQRYPVPQNRQNNLGRTSWHKYTDMNSQGIESDESKDSIQRETTLNASNEQTSLGNTLNARALGKPSKGSRGMRETRNKRKNVRSRKLGSAMGN